MIRWGVQNEESDEEFDEDELNSQIIEALSIAKSEIQDKQINATMTCSLVPMILAPIAIPAGRLAARILGIGLTAYTAVQGIGSVIGWVESGKKRTITADEQRILDLAKAEALAVAAKKYGDEEWIELHKAWKEMESYKKGKIGVTYKRGTRSGRTKDTKNKFYYEKDHTHGDMEIYKIDGPKGIHIGCTSMSGGLMTKPAVKGRTVNLE